MLAHLKTSSPFHHSHRGLAAGDVGAYVVAFEVEWDKIVGLDYNNQLCLDGRMVIEAHQVVKRVFRTVRPQPMTCRL